MSGLFTIRQTQSQSRPDGRMLSCITCGRVREATTNKITPQGGFGKEIMIIGGAPTEQEATRNRLWTGVEGRLLISTFEKYGVRIQHDCISYTTVCHYSPSVITGIQIDCCRKNVLKVIEEYKSKIIVLLGIEAVQSVIGHIYKKKLDSIDLWRGTCIPDNYFQCLLMPIWSPAWVNERAKSAEIRTIWEQDISNIVEHLKTPYKAEKQPEIVYLPEDDLTELSMLIKPCQVAVDFETTGLKPHAPGHRIICASVAVSPDKAYVFPISNVRKNLQPFLDLLKDPQIHKIAHNMKYEHTWAKVRLKTEVYPWDWDTMQAAHIIDNRPGWCGLKFQTYLNFGITDYDSEVSPYISAPDSNGLNKMIEFTSSKQGMKTVMKYCGLDTIYTYRLAMLQQPIIEEDSGLLQAYNLFHEGVLCLAEAEWQGMRIDTKMAEQLKAETTTKIEELENTFFESKFYRHWAHTTTNGKPNINSNQQLSTFLYKTKKIEPKKTTESGKPATDEEALEALEIPELTQLLEIRKWKKIRDTYMESFIREQVNGIIHPFFNLHTVKTYRSSSDSPNFQNVPKRDKEAMKLIRSTLYPRPGHQLMEVDFSAIEVSIAACYHKDPVMLDYLIHGKDMHSDMAAQIFEIDPFDKHKPAHSLLRKAAKNGFVFPQFYGDYYRNNAVGLLQWCKLPTEGRFKAGTGVFITDKETIADHLIRHKIKDVTSFIEHIRRIEDDFWNNRFKVYARWKDRWVKQYKEQGVIRLHTGFICKGVMSRNDVTNYPVQGAAFHCLLWCFNRITYLLKEEHLNTKLIGQIHDAMVLDVCPEELEEVWDLLRQVTEEELARHYPWIIVPMRVEAEITPINGSWAELSELELK